MRSNDDLRKPCQELLGLNKRSEVREEKRIVQYIFEYYTKAFRPLSFPGNAYQIFMAALSMLNMLNVHSISPLLVSFPPVSLE